MYPAQTQVSLLHWTRLHDNLISVYTTSPIMLGNECLCSPSINDSTELTTIFA